MCIQKWKIERSQEKRRKIRKTTNLSNSLTIGVKREYIGVKVEKVYNKWCIAYV